jgi:hypothetical protein
MLGLGGTTVAKAGKLQETAEAALREAVARLGKVRERLTTAPTSDLESLAGEAARAAELVEAHRVRAEAAGAVKAKAEAEALESTYRQAEAEAGAAHKRVRELGAAMSARSRAFAAELVASARELEEVAAKGRTAKDSLPLGKRQDSAPDAIGASPWLGALYGQAPDVLRAASFVLSSEG